VVLPEQEIWDPELQRFVQGDLVSEVFF
jgi:hypothetical protein